MLCLTGAVSVAVSGEVNLFIYHRFGEEKYPSTNIAVDQFESHLEHLKQSETEVVSLSEVVSRLKSGQKLPVKAAVLTVDDAFDSFLSHGMPLIHRYNFPVTLFVNTDSVGTHGYLNWDQLRSLVKGGVVVGNHSATHDYLIEREAGESTDAWRKRVEKDILRAQSAFQRELGLKPNLFAYPYGEFSNELIEIVQSLGFDAAIAQQSGVVDESTDLFTVPRFPMGGPYATLKQFRSKLSMNKLDAEVIGAVDTIPDSNPPAITVRLDTQRFDVSRLQGFVQGNNKLKIEKVSGSQSDFLLQAEAPLTGRRNKYTLTVPLKSGGWGWFSYPWFLIQ
jgi:peptidoglycan/xylan/chitin deacetylase (PgdA/CDA1 family)